MRRLEVVIVAGDGVICRALTEAVSRMPEMSAAFCTGSESCAIEYMQMHRTDILFLEMDLAEGNGMSLLEQMECTVQPRPLLIAMMESGQTAVLEYLRSHGIDYICQKGKNDDSPQRLIKSREIILSGNFCAWGSDRTMSGFLISQRE